jgi:hypothetical protein
VDIATVGHRTVKFSDISREPHAVSKAVDHGPLTVTRRDGAPLVLMLKADSDAARRGLMLAAQVIGVVLAGSAKSLPARLAGLFPWVAFLSDHEKTDFAAELTDTTRACASIADFGPLETMVHAWQSTSEAYAAGWDGEIDDWLDEPIRVERPAQTD